MPWIEVDNPALGLVRGDWFQAVNMQIIAHYALSSVSNHLDSAWMGSTPARDEFAGGLADQRKIVESVWDEVQTALRDTFKAEPEKIMERVY